MEEERKKQKESEISQTLESFSRGERNDFIRIGKRLAEYLHENNIRRIVFLDAGARSAYLCLLESWHRLYPQETHPEIYFINPLGLNTQEMMDDVVPPKKLSRISVLSAKHAMNEVSAEDSKKGGETTRAGRTKVEVQEEFESTYRQLTKDKESSLLVFDTCQHTGLSTDPILRTLEQIGFKDVQLGLASQVNDLTTTQPDFIALKGEAHGRCYPFDRESLIKKRWDSVLSLPVTSAKEKHKGIVLRQTIKRIFDVQWDVVVKPEPVMKLERLGFPNETVITRPPSVDLFYAGKESNSFLPTEIATHPTLIEQARERRIIHARLHKVFTKIPDVRMGWSTALEQGLIIEEDIQEVYQELLRFLQSDPNNARILLYLPFEMLLSSSELNHLDDSIGTEFQKIYHHKWLRLLFENEPRVNFVDGDIPEVELGRGEPVIVHKAAHMIPELLSKKWLSISYVIAILEIAEDAGLESGIFEGLQAAYRRNLLTISEIDALRHSTRSTVVEFAHMLDLKNLGSSGPIVEEKPPFHLETFLAGFEEEHQLHQDMYSQDSPFVQQMTKARYRWEKKDRYEKLLNQDALKLVPALQDDILAVQDILPDSDHVDQERFSRLLIKSIFLTTESLANENKDQAKTFFEKHTAFLEKAWNVESLTVRNDLYSGWSHLIHLDILAPDYVHQFNLQLPIIDTPQSADLEKLAKNELQGVQHALKLMESDDVLQQNFYPVFVLWGSRIKGYPTLESDTDFIGFQKEATANDTRSVEDSEATIAQAVEGKDSLLKFLVQEENGKYKIMHLPTPKEGYISPTVTQPLLGAVWIGDQEIVKKIQGSVIERFVNLERFGEKKEEVRSRLLRNLEGETLQARLLHRGYRFFYADQIPAEIKQEKAIDGDSAFWDPGYRRMASQLFLSRVFLPDLS